MSRSLAVKLRDLTPLPISPFSWTSFCTSSLTYWQYFNRTVEMIEMLVSLHHSYCVQAPTLRGHADDNRNKTKIFQLLINSVRNKNKVFVYFKPSKHKVQTDYRVRVTQHYEYHVFIIITCFGQLMWPSSSSRIYSRRKVIFGSKYPPLEACCKMLVQP